MEGVLQKLTTGHKTQEKEMKKTNNLLADILRVQVDILDEEKERNKQAKRDIQTQKRKTADARKQEGIFKKQGEKAAKKGGLLDKLFGSMLGGIGGVLGGIGALGLAKALGLGAIGAAITAYFTSEEFRNWVNEGLFGKKGLFGEENRQKLMEALFGKQGLFGEENRAKMMEALFGKKGLFGEENRQKLIENLFGKKGLFGEENRAKMMEALFGKQGLFGEDNRAKMMEALFGKQGLFGEENQQRFVDFLGKTLDMIGDALKGLVSTLANAIKNAVTDSFMGLFGGRKRSDRTKKVATDADRARTEFSQANIGTPDFTKKQQAYTEAAKREQASATLDEKLYQLENVPEGRGRGGRNSTKRGRLKNEIREVLKDYPEFANDPQIKALGLQSGGFVGTVPNQGGNGDRFGTMVSPGSVVLNQTAAGMFQSGGMVPVMLEQGEKVFGPRDPMAGTALMMNSMIPRFQEGGTVSRTDASGARGISPPPSGQNALTIKTELGAARATEGKAGSDALIAAAEASTGMMAGVAEQCANSTRAVLKAAGHPAADKTTSKGDLDPEGLAYNGKGFAASFAGSDMGKVYTDINAVPPGGILLWKDTYGNFAPGAITHVGMKGEGNTQYDHGSGPGWRKRSTSSLAGNFAYGIDLNGEASGFNGLTQGISSIFQAGSAAFSALADAFSPILGPLKEQFGEFAGLALGPFAALIGGGQKESVIGGGGDPVAGDNIMSGAGGTSSASVSNPTARAVLDSIAVAEGTMKGGYGTMFGGKVNKDLADGKLTVAQAIALGNKNPGSGATGRYQFMPKTLQDLVRTGHLTMDTQFTPEAQDKAALDLISRRGINLNDGLSKKEMQGIAYEWASVAGAGYTYKGRSQAKYSKDAFLKMVEDRGGTIQSHQTGGVANMRGATSMGNRTMVQKSQEQFAKQIASATQPVVVPVPMGGGGGSKSDNSETAGTPFPNLPAEDNSVVSMEYKYRITMGASV